jgi:hypothetical protein
MIIADDHNSPPPLGTNPRHVVYGGRVAVLNARQDEEWDYG